MEGVITGPGTVKWCALASQGSGVGTGVSDRTASRGTRNSGLEKTPSNVPGSKSVTLANGMNWSVG